MNFKIENTSIRLFDGVDYNEEKKKRDEQLRQLMLSEMSITSSRRAKKTVEYEDVKEETSAETHHKRIIRLPVMHPFQVLIFN